MAAQRNDRVWHSWDAAWWDLTVAMTKVTLIDRHIYLLAS